MPPDADAIAQCVLSTYDQLPDKRKPRPRPGGAREWVPLAGIVLSKGMAPIVHPIAAVVSSYLSFSEDGKLACVSLGTGMKCLPSNKLPSAQGNILHDWHAEILAIRAFNRFLVDQCLLLSTPPYHTSPFLRQRAIEEQTGADYQPFTLQEDVQIHMYCSEAPCGDASMELVMDAQEDATPWTSAPATVSAVFAESESTQALDKIEPLASALRGRSNFSLLGAVRCKPSRPDAPPTLSKSCTDKLALKQATSLLLSTTSMIVSPRNAYIHSLILPDSQFVPSACDRAFSRSGRMASLAEEMDKNGGVGGYRWHSFEVRGTTKEFTWCRRKVNPGEKAVPSNMSAIWTPGWQETVIAGVQQGRKQLDPRGASAICRRSMWKTAIQVAAVAGVPALVEALGQASYQEVKNSRNLEARRGFKAESRKESLKGWARNAGDDTFCLDIEKVK